LAGKTSVFLSVGVLAVGLPACREKGNTAVAAAPPEVEVARPIQKEVFEYEILPGRVEAVDSVEIKARVNGKLEKVEFVEGAEIKAGDPLFAINPREYEARLESAKATLERTRAALEKADSDLKRATRLRESNAISQEELELRQTQHLDAQGNQRAAQAAVDSAALDLEYTRITSPIDGKISSLVVTRGNLISIGDTLTTVVRQAPVYVTFEIPERSVLRWDGIVRAAGGNGFAESVLAEVGLLNDEGFPHEARVDFVDNAVKPSTGTLRVRAILENKDRNARVGLYARVRLSLKNPVKTLLVPERAVGTDQGQRFVYVLNGDSTVSYRKVKTGQVHSGLLSVFEGISAGDRVVTEGLLTLKEGAKVSSGPTPAS
jgi:RND family efflux transporter MFP subunit